MSGFIEMQLGQEQSVKGDTILEQLLTLPLNINQQKLAPGRVDYALTEFPDNTRAAYLLAKLKTFKLTRRELKELEPLCYFPEEHGNGKPWAKEQKRIKIDSRTIEIVNQNPHILFDRTHLHAIRQVLETANIRSPRLVQGLLKIFIIQAKEDQQYTGQDGYNGWWTQRQCDNNPTGIVLTQNGYRVDIAHRISGIDNLRGTLAHEIGHFIYFLYPGFVRRFRNSLGYHPIADIGGNIVDFQWERHVDNKKNAYFVHRRTGIISYMPFAPRDLDLLPSKYAGYYPEEDMAETYVAWLLKQPLDTTRQKLLDSLF